MAFDTKYTTPANISFYHIKYISSLRNIVPEMKLSYRQIRISNHLLWEFLKFTHQPSCFTTNTHLTECAKYKDYSNLFHFEMKQGSQQCQLAISIPIVVISTKMTSKSSLRTLYHNISFLKSESIGLTRRSPEITFKFIHIAYKYSISFHFRKEIEYITAAAVMRYQSGWSSKPESSKHHPTPRTPTCLPQGSDRVTTI